jgi:hypothetical protein
MDAKEALAELNGREPCPRIERELDKAFALGARVGICELFDLCVTLDLKAYVAVKGLMVKARSRAVAKGRHGVRKEMA